MDALARLLPPLLAGLAVSFLLERFLRPKPKLPWQRAASTLMLHCGGWMLLFAIELALFQRLWFAAVMLWAFQLLLLLVNHAKYDSLREPFIFQDFEYFTDAIKHPRLYLPFFGVGRTIAATIGFAGAFTVGMWLEIPLTALLTIPVLLSVWLSLVICSLFLIKTGLNTCPVISCDPAKDLYDLGQSAFFWAYWQDEKLSSINLANSPFKDLSPDVADRHLAHIVAVQSESFFDARRLSGNIKSSVLEHFDLIKTEAVHHGRLQVPAWGANTVRTECGFLTGLTPEQLGIHRFNPYRLLAKQSIPNLAAYYRQLGYQTVCIHPYPSSFYQRDQVFPRMGFDRFIDINSFNEKQKYGQYISDLAVADKVSELLQNGNEKPLFIFVITMENHGPLHLEQPKPADLETCYQQMPSPEYNDLTVYLGHLKNAGLMIKNIKDALLACRPAHSKDGREGILCWYGDHVPIMTGVYEQIGEPDGHTDYFIWQTLSHTLSQSTTEQKITVSDLTTLMLNLR
ncbi:MAG: LTA synthase family protein [Methylococcaceae bacterium]